MIKTCLSLSALLALLHTPVYAITANQAKTAIEAYNKTYWRQANKTFFKYDNQTGELDYWMWAHAWETEMDAYERTKDPSYLPRIRDCYDGFIARYGGTNLWNRAYNDDIGWWVMAANRAYDLTGVADYLTLSKKNFDWMYANEVDTVFGGGIWWRNVDKIQKNSAATLPFSVAGFMLARQSKDPAYGDKAKKLHLWVKAKLFRGWGEVADRIQKVNGKDSVFWGPLSYNHGTFISSSWEMFKLTKDSTYFKDAIATLDYFKNVLSNKTTGILPDERGDGTGNTDNDAGMYKTVFVHYAMRFIMEAKQWQYLPWMNANAESLWNNRRAADNLMYFAWATPTPTQSGKVGAQMASGGVALLNLMVIADSLAAAKPVGLGRPVEQKKSAPEFALGILDRALTYSLPEKGPLTIALYDFSGRLLQTLYSGSQDAGKHILTLPAAAGGSGNRFLRIEFNGRELLRRFVPGG